MLTTRTQVQDLRVNARQNSLCMVCPICDESIVDASSHTSGQAAIFIEGLRKEWLHRQCAGLSKTAFDLASQSQDSFFCRYCRLDTQSRELLTLNAAIATLNEELTAVKNQMSNSQQSPSNTTSPSSSATSNQVDSKAAPELPSDTPLQPQHNNKALTPKSNILVSWTKSSMSLFMA